jgi:hypothetical protein
LPLTPEPLYSSDSLTLPRPAPSPAAPSSGGSSGGSSGTVLNSGRGSGSIFYDVRTACPSNLMMVGANIDPSNSVTLCESFTPGSNQLTLMQRGSNNVVAINDQRLNQNTRAQWCGKKVVVKDANGNVINAPDGGSFFVWDGCQVGDGWSGGLEQQVPLVPASGAIGPMPGTATSHFGPAVGHSGESERCLP